MLRFHILRPRGFTLVELTIVLVIISLLLGMLMGITTGYLEAQRAELTRTKMRTIDAALVSYVAINKRLPCPADGTLDSGAVGAGTELGGGGTADKPCSVADQKNGVIPWVTLGLSAADAEDGWGTRFTYRLDYVLARDNAMDMSGCDPAGTGTPQTSGAAAGDTVKICVAVGGACLATDLSKCVPPVQFLRDKGIRVNDGAGAALMDPSPPLAPPPQPAPTGAAYVLISHGENRSGGFSPSGVILSSTALPEGDSEGANRGDGTYARLATAYVDIPQNFTKSNSRFDDFLLRPSVLSVIQRAHLGPRSH